MTSRMRLVLGLTAWAGLTAGCVDFDEQFDSFCAESGRCSGAPVACTPSGGTCQGAGQCCGEDSCFEGTCQLVGGPSRVQILPDQPVISSGRCDGPVRIRVTDDKNRLARLSEATSVFILSQQIEIFAESTCTDGAGLVVLQPGAASEFDVWLRTEDIEEDAVEFRVETAQGAVASRTALVRVLTGYPARLTLQSEPLTGLAGDCLGPLAYRLLDFAGRDTFNREPMPLAVTSSSDAGFFFTDSSCEQPWDGHYPADSGVLDVFHRELRMGQHLITSISPFDEGGDGGVFQTSVTVAPAALAAITLSPEEISGAPEDCSYPVTIRLQDPFGNPAPLEQLANVRFDPGNAAVHDDKFCQPPAYSEFELAAGDPKLEVYLQFSDAGTVVTASLELPDAGTLSDSVTLTVLDAQARQLQFSKIAPDVNAGCVGPFHVSVSRGDAGMAAYLSDTEIALESNLNDSFFEDPSCKNRKASVRMQAGATDSDEVYALLTQSGPRVLRASELSALDGVHAVQVNAGPASAMDISDLPPLKAGVCSPLATASIVDAFGNPTSRPSASSVRLKGTGPGTPEIFTDKNCTALVPVSIPIPAGDSTVSFYVRATTAGTGAIEAIPSTGISEGSEPLEVVAAAASKWFFLLPTETIGRNGCYAASARLRDEFENPASAPATGVTTTLSVGSGTAALWVGSPTSNCSAVNSRPGSVAPNVGWFPFYLVTGSTAGARQLSTSNTSPVLLEANQSVTVSACDSIQASCTTSSCCPGMTCGAGTCCKPRNATCFSSAQCCGDDVCEGVFHGQPGICRAPLVVGGG